MFLGITQEALDTFITCPDKALNSLTKAVWCQKRGQAAPDDLQKRPPARFDLWVWCYQLLNLNLFADLIWHCWLITSFYKSAKFNCWFAPLHITPDESVASVLLPFAFLRFFWKQPLLQVCGCIFLSVPFHGCCLPLTVLTASSACEYHSGLKIKGKQTFTVSMIHRPWRIYKYLRLPFSLSHHLTLSL